jgi:membrane fusion protein, heavy metal efflux system
MRHALVVMLALVAATAAPSCRRSAEAEHGHDEERHVDASAAEGTAASPVLSLEGLRGIRWMTAPDARAEGAWFAGEAIGDESAEVTLSSPVSGRVASPPYAPGRPVPRGTELVRIDSPEQAELLSRLSATRAEVERADSALVREERLAAAGATSSREVDDARYAARAAHAAYEAAQGSLDARGLAASDRPGRVVMKAPAAGTVLRWSVREGQGVEAGQELGAFQLHAARLVRVDLPLPGPSWRLGDDTEVRTSDGRRWAARVAGVPAALASDTRRLSYRLELEGSALPLPGQPVEVRVPFGTAVILPQAALQQIEGTWGVFVRAGDRAEFHPVRRGVELGADVAVEDGVHPGEELAADGAYLLKSLWLKSRSGGDEHEH